jgi:hypothetical protein
MSTAPAEYWDTPSDNDGMPDDDQLLDMAIAEDRTTPDEVSDALRRMIGLVQDICRREDCPAEIQRALKDQRFWDAREVAKNYL